MIISARNWSEIVFWLQIGAFLVGEILAGGIPSSSDQSDQSPNISGGFCQRTMTSFYRFLCFLTVLLCRHWIMQAVHLETRWAWKCGKRRRGGSKGRRGGQRSKFMSNKSIVKKAECVESLMTFQARRVTRAESGGFDLPCWLLFRDVFFSFIHGYSGTLTPAWVCWPCMASTMA